MILLVIIILNLKFIKQINQKQIEEQLKGLIWKLNLWLDQSNPIRGGGNRCIN
jgi:hypothetical protein